MKTLVFYLFIITALNVVAQHHAGNKNKAVPPEKVLASFTRENPNTEARWKSQDTNYRAEYIDVVNVAHIRVYDKQGYMVYRDDVVESFPVPIQNFYSSKYPGEGFVTWSHIDSKGALTYYADRNAETFWFDRDGRYIDPKKSKSRFADSISVIEPATNE